MAEQLSGVAGSLQGTLQGSIDTLTNKAQSWLDMICPPETRNKIMAWISKFAAERPMLASFLASHIALSGPAIGLFLVMTLAIAVFAILVATILAILGTVLFIVAVAGFGLIFLLPVLFVTTGIATFIWLWGVGVYYLLKYFNEKDIPGIHVPMKEGLEGEASDYADRGKAEGYGQDVAGMLNGKSEEQKDGEKQRVEAEKSAQEKIMENPSQAGKAGMDAGKGVKDQGQKGVGKATDTVNGVAGATPAGGVTKGVTGQLKGVTG